jgi:hypothetical protein
MTHLRTVLLTVAFVATCYAGVSLMLGFDADFMVGAITAILALGGSIWRDHVEHARQKAYFEWADHDWGDWFLIKDDEL